MAVIGSAEIIVRAITTGFEDTIRNDLKRISGRVGGGRAGESLGQSLIEGFARSTSGNIFGNLADGLKNIEDEAVIARERFQSLVRVGYVLQGAFGLIVGAISPVIVSLGTLIGVLGRAAPAALVLVNAFVALRVAMATAKFGFGDIGSAVQAATQPVNGLGDSLARAREEFQQLQFDAEQAALSERGAAINLEKALEALRRSADLPPNSRARREAELAYEEAELAYRRAKDRTRDLNEEVAKGPEAIARAGATDPFAGLNEAQREFAEYLVSLKPKIDALELSVSKALLPPLRKAVEFLERSFLPILEQRLPEIAKQVGDGLRGIVEGLDFDQINRILLSMTTPFGENGKSNLELFSELLGNILDIFLQITEATAKPLNDLLTFLTNKTGEFADNLNQADLTAFFDEAGKYAADLFEIIGNVFGGINNLINLTTGPGSAGEAMIQWMKDSTAEFKNMFSEDPAAGKQFFKDAFANAQSVLGAIGAFLMEILKIADNPAIKEAFDALAKSAPAFGDLLTEVIKAAPSFAELLSTLIEIGASLTDSDQISAFFDTLNEGAKKLNDFLKSDFGQTILDNLGPIFGFVSAVGLIFDAIKFAFKVIVGFLLLIVAPITLISNAFKTLKAAPGGLAKAFKGAGILGFLVLLVTKAVEFYNTLRDFRSMVDTVFGNIGAALGRLGESIGELFGKLFGGGEGGGLLSAFDPFIKLILEILIPIFGGFVEAVINGLTFIFDFLNTIVDAFLPVIENLVNAVTALLKGDLGGAFEFVLKAFGDFLLGMIQLLINGVIDLVNLAIRQLNILLRNLPQGIKDTVKNTFGIDLNTGIPEVAKVDWVGDVQRGRDRQAIRDNFTGSSDRALMSRFAQQNTSALPSTREAGTKDARIPSINVTVNPSAKMDEKELADVVSRRIALEVKKGKL
jgi:phage-related protein